MLTLSTALALLREKNVPTDLYTVGGQDLCPTLIHGISLEHGTWQTYLYQSPFHYKPPVLTQIREFASETEAAQDFLEHLLDLPSGAAASLAPATPPAEPSLTSALALLLQHNIPEYQFTVGGYGTRRTHRDDCVGIALQSGTWQTYLFDRGAAYNEQRFPTETAATRHFLQLIQPDLTWQQLP